MFGVDDGLGTHWKPREAGLEAMGLWVVTGSVCGQQLTDGIIPGWYVASWPDGDVLAKRLVEVDLWHAPGHSCDVCPQPAAGSWVFHDWFQRNPSRVEILKKRADRQRAGQAGGQASASARAQAKASAGARPNAQAVARPEVSTPSRPVPTLPVVTLVSELTRRGDTVTTTTIERWAERHTPGIDIAHETAAFLARNDGQHVTDLRAAWQAWMRTAVTRATASRTKTGAPNPDDPRCPVDGHEHELAANCRICASDRLAADHPSNLVPAGHPSTPESDTP